MKGVLIIAQRELAGLFLMPLAWILLCLTLFLNGWLFSEGFLPASGGEVNSSLREALGSGLFWLMMVFLPPLLTMRMISEESKSGVLEFLLTAPVRDSAVVLGKALAATTFMGLLWSSVIVYAVVLAFLGGAPDWGQVFCGVLGATLVSALFCAVGLVASACTSTPLLAAFLAFLANVVLILIVPNLPLFLRNLPQDSVRAVVSRVNLMPRYANSFQRGVLDSADVAFFVVWTGLLLFVCVRLVEARRWK